MMQDGEESAKEDEKSNMLEGEEASPIGNQSDPRAKNAPSGPDSSDNDLMEMNQQLPNKENLFDEEEGDKQQLVDNLEDMMQGQVPRGSNMRADKVGDVIGNELDIEFDEEIQDNILGRRTGESSQEKEEMVDVEDVNIIVDGDQEFEEEEGSERNLNRKTDNMADYEMDNKLKNLQIIDD